MPIDGSLTIHTLGDVAPPMRWPVDRSHFKALVALQPGTNRFRLDFTSPDLPDAPSARHSSYMAVSMTPPQTSPPLHLVIMRPTDAPDTDDLPTAIKKFRMAAYLWQAHTSEQMHRAKFGRRAFRFEDEWTTATSSRRDADLGIMRNEARVHVIPMGKTRAELRAATEEDLWALACAAVADHFKPRPGQKVHAAVLLLDANVRNPVARGGYLGDVGLALLGSHALSTYPSCFDELVSALSNGTLVDVAGTESTAGEACSASLGLHLQQIGRLYGARPRESGIMAGDYKTFHRAFVVREPDDAHRQTRGELVLAKDDCHWHPLDLLHFRTHPAFAAPHEGRLPDYVHAWPVDHGDIILTAPSGIRWLELYTSGDEDCHAHLEYPESYTHGHPRCPMATVCEADLRLRLPESRRQDPLRVVVYSAAGAHLDLPDLGQLMANQPRKTLSGQTVFRSVCVGWEASDVNSVADDTASRQLIFKHTTKVVTKVIIRHGPAAVHALEFVYDDASSLIFGTPHESSSTGEFCLGKLGFLPPPPR